MAQVHQLLHLELQPIASVKLIFLFFQFNWHMQSLLGGSLLGVLLILLILYCGCTTLCGCQLPCIPGRTGNRRRHRRWRGSAISLRDDVNSYPMTHLRSNINNNSQMITPAFTPEQWQYLTPLIQQQQRSLTNKNRPALGYLSPSTTRSSAPALQMLWIGMGYMSVSGKKESDY